MTCRRNAALLETFLDGELPAEQTIEMEAHLSECGSCRERAAFETALKASMKRAIRTDAEPSSGFETRLEGALRAERERILGARASSAPPRPRRRWPATAPLFFAAAATLPAALWWTAQGSREPAVAAVSPPVPSAVPETDETPEEMLDELVNYHAAPPTPQITEPDFVEKLEPEVGVPVRLPSLKQYGAAWEGGSVIPMRNKKRAAIFRYRLSNHPVTVYVYNAGRMPLRGVLEPRVVRNQAIHVGERRGYSIAALERRGVGYAVTTDLNNDESAELVTTIY